MKPLKKETMFILWKKTPVWILTGGIVVLFLLFSACGYLLVGIYNQKEMDRKEATKLNEIMMSLNNIQGRHEKYKFLQEQITHSTIQRMFPWLPKNNTLPNYFLYYHTGMPAMGPMRSPARYRHSNIVFMVNPHESGMSLMNCLQTIASNYSLPMSPVMSSRNRIAWEMIEGQERLLQDRIKVHRGSYTFGMCENLNSTCSYFLLLQDPLERALSTYHYCKEAIGDELCSVINANKVSIHEWIVQQGSLLFRQLLFHQSFCDLKVNGTALEGNYLINRQNLPCWYKQKLHFDTLSPPDLMEAVNYVVENLDKWFAVLGHAEELSASVKMFEHVYQLPFSKCNIFPKLAQENLINDNRAYRGDHEEHSIHKEDVFLLQQNSFVKKALQADYRIYNKAKKLFKIQRQVLFNQLGH